VRAAIVGDRERVRQVVLGVLQGAVRAAKEARGGGGGAAPPQARWRP
jgi:hypothetical protein